MTESSENLSIRLLILSLISAVFLFQPAPRDFSKAFMFEQAVSVRRNKFGIARTVAQSLVPVRVVLDFHAFWPRTMDRLAHSESRSI